MIFRLYNTMTKQIEPLAPADPGAVTFYTCGPTVYDDAHIGNFRSFLAADLLRRWLESPLCTLQTPDGHPHSGPRTVTHVMNITDVGHMTDDANADGAGEDKMLAAAARIQQAKKDGKLPKDAAVDPDDPFAVAEFYRERFLEDARALALKVALEAQADPTLMPRATHHVDAMRAVIARLLDQGHAYHAGSPGARAVYFDVQKADRYGRLSGNTLDRLRGGAGGRVDDHTQLQKKHPADFLLWKEDPAHKMKWPAPNHPALKDWAMGYPGWHIECTAMALGRLVEGGLPNANKAQIDLHSGGEDNIFPHHECEIAQSCAYTGAPAFARHWFHPRFLMVDGKKMSKSAGTFFTPRQLIAEGHDPAAVRLELIKTHYRSNADFSKEGLESSAKRVARWRAVARDLIYSTTHDPHVFEYEVIENGMDRALAALHDDLNLSELLSLLDRVSRSGAGGVGEPPTQETLHALPFPEEPMSTGQIDRLVASSRQCDRSWGYLHAIDRILGVIFRPLPVSHDTGIAVYLPGAQPSDEVEQLLAQRRDAKKAKDFATADTIRAQLSAMGYTIKDVPAGKVEVART